MNIMSALIRASGRSIPMRMQVTMTCRLPKNSATRTAFFPYQRAAITRIR